MNGRKVSVGLMLLFFGIAALMIFAALAAEKKYPRYRAVPRDVPASSAGGAASTLAVRKTSVVVIAAIPAASPTRFG